VTSLTPKQLGALRPFASFDHDGHRHRIAYLFRLRVVHCEKGTPNEFPLGKIRYGFIAQNGAERILFDWDEQSARSNKMVILSNVSVR
jgi:hypothetical protein